MRQQHEEQEPPQQNSLQSHPIQPPPLPMDFSLHADGTGDGETHTETDAQRNDSQIAVGTEQVSTGQTQVKTRLEGKRQGRKWRVLHPDPHRAALTGILASNGMALVVMLLTRWLFSLDQNAGGVFTMGEFVLLPMAMGGVCAYFWQEAKLSKVVYLLYGLLNIGVALLLSYVFLQEGSVCLLMASPLLLVFALLGCFIGRKIFASKHRQLNATLAPIMLTLFILDSVSPHHFVNEESDRIVINAPPARVWQYIIAYPVNTAPPDYWLWRVGLPAPTQSTADGNQVGANRKCLFTGNIAFEEKLTVVKPGRELAFDVTTQPNHPEVIGHFELQKGQFTLEDNGNGTTTLVGTTWYKLNVYPICYYDWWTQDIIRNVHLRVMRHIKRLAEDR